MAKLKIDLDALDAAISTYETEVNSFKSAKKNIQKSLDSLRASGWDSQASKVWFSLLDDEWLQNIDYQIRVLDQLRGSLVIARTEYTKVKEEQDRLQNYV